MKQTTFGKCRSAISNDEGKGTLGCLISLLLLAIAAFVATRVGPSYLAYKSFQVDVKAEVSRAGANFWDDETLTKNVLDMARRNEIRLKRENVKVERFAAQVRVTVHYSAPIDLVFYQYIMDFDIQASSYVGRL